MSEPSIAELGLQFARDSHQRYVDASGEMLAAKEQRRKAFTAVARSIGTPALARKMGMERREIEAIIDGNA